MKTASLLVLAVLVAAPSLAQPTIDSSYLQAFVGRSLHSLTYDFFPASDPQVTSIMQSTGGGATYDFSQLSVVGPTTLDSETRTSFVGTPGEGVDAVSGANLVWINKDALGNETSYSYYRLDAGGYRQVAIVLVQDVTGDTVPDTTWSVFDPPRTFVEFPLTPSSSWTEVQTITSSGPFGTSSEPQTWEVEVDGWGDLVLPGGISVPAYKVRWITTSGPPGAEFTFATIQFLTAGAHSASIVPNFLGPGAQAASYSVISVGTAVEDRPSTEFALGQNYPNPFALSTTIPFGIRSAGPVRVSVIDLLGREVARPVDAVLAAGRHEAGFDASGLVAGVYLYRLQRTGAPPVTRRLAIVR